MQQFNKVISTLIYINIANSYIICLVISVIAQRNGCVQMLYRMLHSQIKCSCYNDKDVIVTLGLSVPNIRRYENADNANGIPSENDGAITLRAAQKSHQALTLSRVTFPRKS